MVAVVSGNGLGLFNTSLNALGAGIGGQAGIGQGGNAQQVNIATGNLILSGWDESLFGRGFATAFTRTYNSQGNFANTGADGWYTGYERTVRLASGTINTAGSTVERATADGAVQLFTWNATNNRYESSAGDGAHDSIVLINAGQSTAKWLWTEGSSQVQEQYAAGLTPDVAGRLESITDLATGAAYTLTYSGNLLSVITGANGETLEFGYDASNRLTSLSTRERDAAGNLVLKGQVTYGYDSASRLSWVQTDLTPTDATDNTWDATTAANNDGKRFRTTYTYVDASSLQISNFSTSDGISVSYTYANGKVATVTQGSATDGSAQTLSYTYNAGSTVVTDSAGRTWTYAYDANGQLTSVTEPAVNGLSRLTNYSYDSAGNVTRISQAGYNGTTSNVDLDTVFKYDANGNVILQRDRLGNTVERTYNAANKVLTEAVYTTPDADGLDPTFIGTTNLPSGALITRYVYDASNELLRFVINAAGEVTENQYNASGTAINQLAVSRRFVSNAYDTSGLTATQVPTLAQMTTWIVGKEAATARSEVSYDAQGRIKQTVEYATVDGSGNGVLDIGTAITNFTYDAQGLLRQRVAVAGASRTLAGAAPTGSAVTDYCYDGMGRLLGVIKRDVATAANDDPNTLNTSYLYLDSANQLKVTLDTDAIRLEARNKAGMLVSINESGTVGGVTVNRTTTNFYDGSGRLRGTEDATGARSYFFYDAAGHLTATVDGTGAVTRTIYDEVGRPIQTVDYGNRVDTSAWLSGTTVTKDTLVYADTSPTLNAGEAWVDTDVARDRNSYRTYDAAGRVATETNATGLITTYSYDGASRLLSTSFNQTGAPAGNARTARMFYDNAGRLVATLDAGGYLTENVYDNGGRLVRKIGYSTAANTAGTDLASVRPTTSASDTGCRYFYDGRGQVVGEFELTGISGTNGQGYLTEYVYDEANNLRATKAYANLVTDVGNASSLSTLISGAGTARVSQRSFNSRGQVTTELNFENTVTTYTYDEAGRLLRTSVQAAGPTTEVRDDYSRYDVFGNVVGKLSGEAAIKAGGSALLTMTEAQLNDAYGKWGTTYCYDLAGRLTESTGPNPTGYPTTPGDKVWYYYDAQGHNTFVVRGIANGGIKNAYGEVTQNAYDAFGQITQTTVYTNRIGSGAVSQTRASIKTLVDSLIYVVGTDTRRQFAYDVRGLLSSSTDALGVASNFTYTVFGQLDQEIRNVGDSAAVTIKHNYDIRGLETSRNDGVGTSALRTTSATYDAFGRRLTSTDARNTVTSYTYDRMGRQLTVGDLGELGAETTTFTYDAYNRVITQAEPTTAGMPARTTTYSYNDSAHSMTLTTPAGVAITTVHNSFGQTVSVTNGSISTVYQYDHDGNLVHKIEQGQYDTQYKYDDFGNLYQTIDADGRVTTYTYDAVGRVLTRTEDPGAGKLNLITTYEYDAQGRQVKVTDASLRVTQMAYDQEGRLVQVVKDPGTGKLALTTNYTYDAEGRQLTVTVAPTTTAEQKVQYGYDALGRRTSETIDPITAQKPGALNLTTTYTYDGNDNVLTRTDAAGNVTHYAYDEDNRVRFVIDATGGVVETYYDLAGRATMTRAYAKPLTGVSDWSLGNIRTLMSQAAQVNDAFDTTTYRVYDASDRETLRIDGTGGVHATTYDTMGRVCMVVDYVAPISLSTTKRDDLKAGRATSASLGVPAAGASDQVTYYWRSNDERKVVTINGLGQAQQTWYDGARHEITTIRYSALVSNFNTLKASLAQGTATYASLGLVADATKDTQQSKVYDAAGRMIYAVDGNGSVVEYKYDAAGRVLETDAYTKAAVLNAAAWTDIWNFATTAAGKIATAVTAAGTAAQKQIYTYDQAGRVTQVKDALNNATQYRYDAAGNRIATVDALGNTTRAMYDAAGRQVYTVDALGGITRNWYSKTGALLATRSYDTLNTTALTDSSTVATMDGITDAAGFAKTTDRGAYYVYDAENRVRISLDMLGDATETTYDGAGRMESSRRYATALGTLSTLATQLRTGSATVAQATPTASSAGDRYSYNVYDAAGRVVYNVLSVDASNAMVGERRYDGTGQLTAQVDYSVAVANAIGTIKTAAQLVTAINTAGGNVSTKQRLTSFAYDLAGRLTSRTDDLLQTESYGYDNVGNRTSYTNKANNTWNYEFDLAGRVVREFAPPVQVYDFDAAGQVALIPNKRILTVTTYDAVGNVIQRDENADATDVNERRWTKYTYDARGALTNTEYSDAWRIDATNNSWGAVGATTNVQVKYDALGNAVVLTDARGKNSYKVYDELGRLAYDVDALGFVTGFNYNAFGDQVSMTRYAVAKGAISNWTVGTAISLTQIRGAINGNDASNRTITTAYDQRGLKTQVTLPQVSYINAAGNLVATGTPTTNFQYDAFGNVVKQSVLLDGTNWADTYTYYDKLGNKTTSVDALGFVTTWSYDVLGQMVSTTEYARAASLTGIGVSTPPALPAAGDEVVGYDRTTTYTYDDLGRKTGESIVRRFANSTGGSMQRAVVTTLGYDAVDHVTSTTVDGATTSMAYDALGRVVSVTEPQRDVTKSSADTALLSVGNNLTSSAVVATAVSPYTATAYDAFGQAVQVRRYANGWTAANGAVVDTARDQVTVYRNDRWGRVTEERNTIGAAETTTVVTYRNYDANGNVSKIWHARAGSVAAQNQTVVTDYTYDDVGRQLTSVTTRVFSGSTATDATEAVSYNAFGEIIGKAAVLADIGMANKSFAYTYDNAGRLITSNEQGATRTYSYNLAGMQRKESHNARVNGASTATAVVTTQTVDALGHVTKVVLPAFDAAGTTATVTARYDRWGNVLEQIDGRGYSTQFAYNDRNQVIRETKPMVGILSETGVMSYDRPVTEYYYDAVGRSVGVRDANGHIKQSVYDAGGNLVKSIDAAGFATLQSYNALGQNVYTQDALGYITFQAYDRMGRVSAHGDFTPNAAGTARVQTTLESFGLDADGNRLTVTNALLKTQKYDYDSRSLLVQSVSATGLLKTYQYDALGRKTRDADATNYETWTYTYDGRVSAHRDLGGANYTYTYAADSLQLIGETSDRAAASTHQVARWWQDDPNLFDDPGYSTTDTTEESYNRTTTYFANGQVKQISDDGNKLTYKYAYDAAGNRTMEETDTVDGQGLHVWVRTLITYDGQNRIIEVSQDDLLTGVRRMNVRYDYDAVGNRRRVLTTASGGTANEGPDVGMPMPSRSLKSGVVSTFTMTMRDYFSDPEQTALTYTVTKSDGTALPSWLTATYDAATGVMTFSSTAATPAGQNITIKIVASDGTFSASQTFALTTATNTTPTALAANTPILVKTGQAINMSIDASDYFVDGDVGDRLTLSFVSVSPSAAWLTVSATTGSPDRLWVTGTPPATAGSWQVTVRATDASGASVTKVITIQSQKPMAPVPTAIANQKLNIGKGFAISRPLSALFTDANADRLNVTAALSGGGALPSWMTLSYDATGNPPRVTLIGMVPPSLTAGTVYNVVLTATDTDGQTASTTVALTLQAAPTNSEAVASTTTLVTNQTATVGSQWTYQVPAGCFSDGNGDTLSYSATQYNWWSEEIDYEVYYHEDFDPLPSWIKFDGTTRTFTATAPAPASFDIAVRVADGSGIVAYQVFHLDVNPATAAAAPVVLTPIPDMQVNRGSAVSISTGFSDPNGTTPTLSAQIAGGGALPSWLTFNASTGVFSGTPPANLTPTKYVINVTASDGALTATDSFELEVVASGAQGQFTASAGSWYTYDVNDRVTLVNGNLVNGQIVLGMGEQEVSPGDYQSVYVSYGLGYDAVGNQVATYSRAPYGQFVVKQSVYDLRGQLQLVYHDRPIGVTDTAANGVAYWGVNIAEQHTYDAAGHLTETREFWNYGQIIPPYYYEAPAGWLSKGESYTYDDDGRCTVQKSYSRVRMWQPSSETNQTIAYQSGSGVALSASPLSLIATTNTNYDSLGRLGTTTYVHNKWALDDGGQTGSATWTQTFTRTYDARETYLEKLVSGTCTNSSYRATTTTSTYDAYGRRVEVREDTTLKDYDQNLTYLRYFSYDAELGILSRRDGELQNNAFKQGPGTHNSGNSYYMYANGQQIARAGYNGALVDAISGLTAYDQTEQMSQATVQTGDTLQSLSQRLYGNSSYWYILAAANGISSDSQLVPGTTLRVPDVKVTKNTSSTFKPYNPEDIIGPTTPNLPHIKPPPPAACSLGASIIRIAALIVAIVQPELSPLLAATIAGGAEFLAQSVEIAEGVRAGYNVGSILGSAILAGVTSTQAFQGTAIAKAAANGSRLARAGIAAGQAVAGQLLGTAINKALGRENNFSWRSVAVGAATAAIGAAAFKGISSMREQGTVAVGGANAVPAQPVSFNWARVSLEALAKEVINYGVSKAVYGEAHWSWASAANTVFSDLGAAWAQSERVRQIQSRATDGVAHESVRAEPQGIQGPKQGFSVLDWVLNNGDSFTASGAATGVQGSAPHSYSLGDPDVPDVMSTRTADPDHKINKIVLHAPTAEEWAGYSDAEKQKSLGDAHSFSDSWTRKVGNDFPGLPADATPDDGFSYVRDVAVPWSQRVQKEWSLAEQQSAAAALAREVAQRPVSQADLQGTNREIAGLTEEQKDAYIKENLKVHSAEYIAASLAIRETAFVAWNAASLGAVNRQDELIIARNRHEITDDEFYAGTTINAASRIAVALSGGVAAPEVLAARLGTSGLGAAYGIGGDAFLQFNDMAINQVTSGHAGQSGFNWTESVMSAAGGYGAGKLLGIDYLSKDIGEVMADVRSLRNAGSADAQAVAMDAIEAAPDMEEIGPDFDPNELDVLAKLKIGGKTFFDVNPRARIGGSAESPTLIRERVIAKELKLGRVLPNKNMADAHAEIGAMQRAFDTVPTAGAHAELTLFGQPPCGYCLGDVPAMAEQLGLGSLRVLDGLGSTRLYWEPGMRSLKPWVY